jgi:hypothetical protein
MLCLKGKIHRKILEASILATLKFQEDVRLSVISLRLGFRRNFLSVSYYFLDTSEYTLDIMDLSFQI